MRGWTRDFTYSLRLLSKTPGFTLLAVLCLGLGVGVNASIFSVLNFFFFRPLPVREADRVVVLSRGASPVLSYPDYRDLRDRSQTLDGLAAAFPTESSLEFDGRSYLAASEPVSLNYPAVLGVRTHLGRWFETEDEQVAVISFRAWQRHFQGDVNVLGKRVRSESQWYTVVGVAAKGFEGIYLPMSMDLWVPLRTWAKQHAGQQARLEDRASPMVFVLGRLKPGATAGQAAAEMNALAAQIRKEQPKAEKQVAPMVVEEVRGVPNVVMRRAAAPVAGVLMAVVGVVLVIACVNVSNLMLARSAARRREISLRIALGAGRSRVLRQLLTESLLLAMGGGLAGLVLGIWINRLFGALLSAAPYQLRLRLDVSTDARVLGFTAAVSLATVLLFGLAPAWQASRTDVISTLKGEAPTSGRFGLRRVSLVAQVALSLVLLLTAGLFLRVVLHFQDADPGFAVENRLYVTTYVSAPEFTPESARQILSLAVDRVRALPGVTNATITHLLPLMPIGAGCAAEAGGEAFPAISSTVGQGYLATMRIPLVAGRDFSAADLPSGPLEALRYE